MHPSHLQFLTDISFKLSECASLTESYNISFVFYISDLSSVEGHDLVMLSLWENFQMAPIPKILEMPASFYDFGASIPQFVLILDYVFLCWVYLSKRGVKEGQ